MIGINDDVHCIDYEYHQLIYYLEFAVAEFLNEIFDVFGGNVVAFRPVLQHLIFHADDAHRGDFLLLDAEELEDALVVGVVNVDDDEENLEKYEILYVSNRFVSRVNVLSIMNALDIHLIAMFFGDRLDGRELLVNVALFLRNEEEQVRLDVTTEDFLGGFVVEFDDEWKTVRSDELAELVGVFAIERRFAFIELKETQD